MQLKRLEAYGFKSFADKITMDFEQGITAVVGPNGSGKSNITDAIRWALGEQNIRNLRGTKAEDLLFTGSASRHALGAAEVSLTFDNSDGTLPVDFQEVVVTRRLYRSGENECYINKSRCRLKDIYNLFADTGIGHDGMSIIGQNRIDAILNARPEERRGFFEETAGITKYRNRKRESLRRLEDTEANLVRVRDITGELEQQLGPLEQAAEKAKRWQDLDADYKMVKVTDLSRDYDAEAEKNAALGKQKQAVDDAITAAETRAKTAEAEKAAAEAEAAKLEDARQKRVAENERQRQAIEKRKQEMAALKERTGQSEAAKERLAREHEQICGEIEQARKDLIAIEQNGKAQEQDLLLASDLLEKEKEKQKKYQDVVESRQESLRQAEEAFHAAEKRESDLRQTLAVLDRDVENGTGSKEETQKALAAARAQLDTLQQSGAEAEAACKSADEAALAHAAALKQAEQGLRAAMQDQREMERARQHMVQEKRDAASRLSMLRRLQKSYEGFGRAPRAILQSSYPWRGGVLGAVAELMEVPRDYVTAIETALGPAAQYLVTEDEGTAKAAIQFLKEQRLGRATFLPLASLVVKPALGDGIQAETGVVGWASELVRPVARKERAQKAIDFLLSRTLVVDTLDHALALARRKNHRLRIVTLGGERLNPGGSLSGGQSRGQETSFLHRQGEMEQASAKVKELEKKEKAVITACQEAEQANALAQESLAAARDAQQRAAVEQARARTNAAQLAERVKQAQAQAQALAVTAEAQAHSFAELQKKRQEIFSARKTAEQALQQAEAVRADAQDAAEDAGQDAADLAEHIKKCELERAVLEQQTLRAKEQAELRRSAMQSSEKRLRQNEQETAKLEAAKQASSGQLETIRQEMEAQQKVLDEGRASQQDLYQQRMKKLAESREKDEAVRAASREAAAQQENRHRLDLQAARIQMKLEEITGVMRRDYGVTPGLARQQALDLPEEELGERLHALRRELDAIGPVNPQAVEEYENRRARYAFLEKQAADLEAAEDNLKKILEEMDAAMTKQFRAAFTAIQSAFQECFEKLFGGGRAELRLVPSKAQPESDAGLAPDGQEKQAAVRKVDILTAGIEILVTLPKKKRQNLAALSGGERALTVIALLFAFLRYKPSPFSVLDEIDAPLDEANVVRFGRFLQELSGDTQFIVVTHRKGTMEAANTLYGVTLEQAGVSRILSVKLDEALE
ncbi:MAG: chromosome segregation protein SMC [Selenomonadaceae bacterium]|nr:chromosome segregation protein SMC [Selenomonadaceae bacterium]MDY2686366.1 chromosome segregation protein SMC [Selenomonadaceae bacterium]